jgi:hypothetical protein
MRGVGLLAALIFSGCGGGDSCDPATACPSTGAASFKFCNGGSDNCYYQGSDGSKFKCTSCGDCSSAEQLALTWCSTAPHGTTGGTTGGTLGSMCSAQGSGCVSGTYQFCTSPTGMSGCGYKTSDGKTFACNACTDCTGAASSVANWCTNGSSTTSTNGSTNGSTGGLPPATTECVASGQTIQQCQSCCTTVHSEGSTKATTLVYGCLCPLCPACSNLSVCGGAGGTASSTCSSCLSQNTNSCVSQVQPQCNTDSGCLAYEGCIEGCG